MATPTTNKLDILHSYRHLMRAGLRAVCFSKPSRYIIRDVLRDGFRDKKAVFEKEKVERTVLFLEMAQRAGFEHKLLKNLTRVSWERRVKHKGNLFKGGMGWLAVLATGRQMEQRKKRIDTDIDGTEFEHFDRTLDMLNQTAGLCLRI
ncbi:hypothetical protein V8F20_001058 [Naviculisporaceae sp. PSN 640]